MKIKPKTDFKKPFSIELFGSRKDFNNLTFNSQNIILGCMPSVSIINRIIDALKWEKEMSIFKKILNKDPTRSFQNENIKSKNKKQLAFNFILGP